MRFQKGKPDQLRVMHISDIHIDMSYVVGTEVNCSEPQCCRMPKNPTEGVSKIHKSAGYWGAVGNCDIPVWTFESMLKYASETHGKV
jgi:sphingomyelin phosphodiesterase